MKKFKYIAFLLCLSLVVDAQGQPCTNATSFFQDIYDSHQYLFIDNACSLQSFHDGDVGPEDCSDCPLSDCNQQQEISNCLNCDFELPLIRDHWTAKLGIRGTDDKDAAQICDCHFSNTLIKTTEGASCFPASNKALQIGNYNAAAGWNSITKTIVIDQENSTLYFDYLLLLETTENTKNNDDIAASFEVIITDHQTGEIYTDDRVNLGYPQVTNKITANNLFNSNWSQAFVDLGGLLDKTIDITFRVNDAYDNTGYGVAFIDNLVLNELPAYRRLNLWYDIGGSTINSCEVDGNIFVGFNNPGEVFTLYFDFKNPVTGVRKRISKIVETNQNYLNLVYNLEESFPNEWIDFLCGDLQIEVSTSYGCDYLNVNTQRDGGCIEFVFNEQVSQVNDCNSAVASWSINADIFERYEDKLQLKLLIQQSGKADLPIETFSAENFGDEYNIVFSIDADKFDEIDNCQEGFDLKLDYKGRCLQDEEIEHLSFLNCQATYIDMESIDCENAWVKFQLPDNNYFDISEYELQIRQKGVVITTLQNGSVDQNNVLTYNLLPVHFEDVDYCLEGIDITLSYPGSCYLERYGILASLNNDIKFNCIIPRLNDTQTKLFQCGYDEQKIVFSATLNEVTNNDISDLSLELYQNEEEIPFKILGPPEVDPLSGQNAGQIFYIFDVDEQTRQLINNCDGIDVFLNSTNPVCREPIPKSRGSKPGVNDDVTITPCINSINYVDHNISNCSWGQVYFDVVLEANVSIDDVNLSLWLNDNVEIPLFSYNYDDVDNTYRIWFQLNQQQHNEVSNGLITVRVQANNSTCSVNNYDFHHISAKSHSSCGGGAGSIIDKYSDCFNANAAIKLDLESTPVGSADVFFDIYAYHYDPLQNDWVTTVLDNNVLPSSIDQVSGSASVYWFRTDFDINNYLHLLPVGCDEYGWLNQSISFIPRSNNPQVSNLLTNWQEYGIIVYMDCIDIDRGGSFDGCNTGKIILKHENSLNEINGLDIYIKQGDNPQFPDVEILLDPQTITFNQIGTVSNKNNGPAYTVTELSFNIQDIAGLNRCEGERFYFEISTSNDLYCISDYSTAYQFSCSGDAIYDENIYLCDLHDKQFIYPYSYAGSQPLKMIIRDSYRPQIVYYKIDGSPSPTQANTIDFDLSEVYLCPNEGPFDLEYIIRIEDQNCILPITGGLFEREGSDFCFDANSIDICSGESFTIDYKGTGSPYIQLDGNTLLYPISKNGSTWEFLFDSNECLEAGDQSNYVVYVEESGCVIGNNIINRACNVALEFGDINHNLINQANNCIIILSTSIRLESQNVSAFENCEIRISIEEPTLGWRDKTIPLKDNLGIDIPIDFAFGNITSCGDLNFEYNVRASFIEGGNALYSVPAEQIHCGSDLIPISLEFYNENFNGCTKNDDITIVYRAQDFVNASKTYQIYLSQSGLGQDIWVGEVTIPQVSGPGIGIIKRLHNIDLNTIDGNLGFNECESFSIELRDPASCLKSNTIEDIRFYCPPPGIIPFKAYNEQLADAYCEGYSTRLNQYFDFANAEPFELSSSWLGTDYVEGFFLEQRINNGDWERIDNNGALIADAILRFEYIPIECPANCDDEFYKYTKYDIRLRYPQICPDDDCLTDIQTIKIYPPLQNNDPDVLFYPESTHPECFRDNIPITTVRPCFQGSDGQISVDVDCMVGGKGPFTFKLYRDKVFNFSWDEDCKEYVDEVNGVSAGEVKFEYIDNCPADFISEGARCWTGLEADNSLMIGVPRLDNSNRLFYYVEGFCAYFNGGASCCPEGYNTSISYDSYLGLPNGASCRSERSLPNGYTYDIINNKVYTLDKSFVEMYEADYRLEVIDESCGRSVFIDIPIEQIGPDDFDFEIDPQTTAGILEYIEVAENIRDGRYFWCKGEDLTIGVNHEEGFTFNWDREDPTEEANYRDENTPDSKITLRPFKCNGGEWNLEIKRDDAEHDCIFTKKADIIDFNPPPAAIPEYEDVLAISATKFRSVWMNDFSDVQFDNEDELVETQERNMYAIGQAGIYRPQQTFDYLKERRQFETREGEVPDQGEGAETVLQTDGVIGLPNDQDKTITKGFMWNHPSLEECVPEWKFNSEITRYNPYNFETENKDILERYSAALYGYKGQIATAVAANAEYSEIAFENFEEYRSKPDPVTQSGLVQQEEVFYDFTDNNAPIQEVLFFTAKNSGTFENLEVRVNEDFLSCTPIYDRTYLTVVIHKNNRFLDNLWIKVSDLNDHKLSFSNIVFNEGDKFIIRAAVDQFGFGGNIECTGEIGFVSLATTFTPLPGYHLFNNSTSNFDFVDVNVNGAKRYLTPYNVLSGFGRYAIIDMPYDALCYNDPEVIKNEEDKIKVDYNAMGLEFKCRQVNIPMETAGRDETVTLRPDPCGTDNTMIVFDENSSAPGFPPEVRNEPLNSVQYWNGHIYQINKQDVSTKINEINRVSFDNSLSHTGDISLKIEGQGQNGTSGVKFKHPDLQLIGGKEYVLSAWIHTEQFKHKPPPKLLTLNETNEIGVYISIGAMAPQFFTSTGEVVEGWQRMEARFRVPEIGGELTTMLNPVQTMYIDDIRLHPVNAGMQTYVYDLQRLRLNATLDHNNFATLYKYDDEGNLFHVAKETMKGIKTIQISSSFIKPNKP